MEKKTGTRPSRLLKFGASNLSMGSVRPNCEALLERLLSGDEKPLSLFRQLARGDPARGDDVCEVPAIAAQGSGSPNMRERIRGGPPDLRQAYMRLLLSRIEIDRAEIRVRGSKTALERLAARGDSNPR
jgi:hypothetical protein